MQFAYPLPWWLALVLAGVISGVTFLAYRRPLAPLQRWQRASLCACRGLALAVVLLLLFRPIVLVPRGGSGSIVPVLVDVSRSMRLGDGGSQTRLARAVSLLQNTLVPALSRQFTPELYTVGDRVEGARLDRLSADGGHSDVIGALAAIRERYRGQPIAGIVLLSDGGDTGQAAPVAAAASGPPIFAVGIGSPDPIRDHEVTAMMAGDQPLDQATVDLRVSAVSFGSGRAPFQLRLLENGRELERRRVAPPADGVPIEAVFTVSPDPVSPTVYSVEIPADESEAVTENDRRSVLVNPAGRKRRLLIIEGAPGFEHSFMKRAWARDPALEVDSVGRKGKNADGQDTFFVQAPAERTAALTRGFPARREDLFAYDGLVLANVEGDFLTRAQMTMAAEFVAERGGGLLVAGGRAFAPRGLAGTPLEAVLPIELDDRRGAPVAMAIDGGASPAVNKVIVTPEGLRHPAMRIGASAEETRRLWSALPPLAGGAMLGGPRPGAAVLAEAPAAAGGVFPVVAVQRYGRGRAMVFGGEASWRWKMLLASTDRSYEYFWRQAARWMAGAADDPVTIAAPESVGVNEQVSITVDVRDAAFAPVADAAIDAAMTVPGGQRRAIRLRRSNRQAGQYEALVDVEGPGAYRVDAEARRGNVRLGQAQRWLDVGGVDREFADPRLNEPWLRRAATASGGRYVRAGDASRIVGWLQDAVPQQAAPERRDLWHQPWALAMVIALLAGEWILRRKWGLR
ncbi:MAG: hypothetical protein ABI868_15210 [Acidobacteriota bacterium]